LVETKQKIEEERLAAQLLAREKEGIKDTPEQVFSVYRLFKLIQMPLYLCIYIFTNMYMY